ncbi:hypothetical protein ScFU149_10650 [Streptococcus canis]|uniref:hypothetical protein n=1 Tax=Streptococcus canis TaxID=1329 RepID=UPI000C1C727B|nr:hypothetical protein [Streptococcus canis]GAY70412.1 uncharacterized protein TANIYAMA4_0816 [Streptococcus canis]GFE45760.1 hypothetical protein ScFU6_15290 [Streptococcus canis]GFK30949.1 hypothetical protein ScFU149_10650 [Streptococcus canis]
MNLLHKKSILDCSELEERIHQAETNQLLEMITSLPNFDCDFEVTFEDDYHKKMNYPLFYESNLHQISDFIETRDIKNGVDTLLTEDNHLSFRAFGQHYTAEGKDGILTTLITVKCFGEGRMPIDMSRYFSTPEPTVENSLTL